MSKDMKFFARPKVRFSQIDMQGKNEDLKNSEEKNVGRSEGPRIRSIISLNKPIRIVNLNEVSNSLKTNVTCDNTQKKESPGQCKKTLSSSCSNSVSTENQEPLSEAAGNCQNIKANSGKTDVLKVSDKVLADSAKNSVPCLRLPVAQDELSDKVLTSQSNTKASVLKGCVKSKRGKENEESAIQRNVRDTKKDLTGNVKSGYYKTKSCSTVTNSRKPNILTKSHCVPTKNLRTKPVSVMPCHKHTKVASKIKTSPVKKTVIRDIMARKVKPYIGPGISRKKENDPKLSENSENTHSRPVISGDKLARPEYNSIMCTLNKMKEIKKQKIVTDFEHLPTAYKNLVNGKVSTTLDFPLYESTYKNLVDLSVDDKQLPGRLTRSKDPEPRQRDIMPVLSDFFTPVSTEEYCTSVSVEPRTPEYIESWDAFRISDITFEWKQNMEHP